MNEELRKQKEALNSLNLTNEVIIAWLGMRDSNPRSWDQNPVPYHLANPQRQVGL